MAKSKQSLSYVIKEMYKEKTTITLSELYNELKVNPDLKWIKDHNLKHRIRSCIYSLNKSGYLKRTDKSTYETTK